MQLAKRVPFRTAASVVTAVIALTGAPLFAGTQQPTGWEPPLPRQSPAFCLAFNCPTLLWLLNEEENGRSTSAVSPLAVTRGALLRNEDPARTTAAPVSLLEESAVAEESASETTEVPEPSVAAIVFAGAGILLSLNLWRRRRY